MNFIFLILILAVITISMFNYFRFIRKKSKYIKASRKWDEIVRELSRRK